MKLGKHKDGLKRFSHFVINKFELLHWKRWAIYCAALFTVGAFINVATGFRFPHFALHQLLLIAATTLLVRAMKSFFQALRNLEGSLIKVAEVKSLYISQLHPLQENPCIFLISVIVMVFFFSCIFMLEYICWDAVGIYALYIAGSSIMIGTYAYVQYLYFLWFIYRIGNVEFDYYSYDRYCPAETKWLVMLSRISQNLRNYFLSVGLLYTLEFCILIPVDKIEVSEEGLLLHTSNNIAFVLFWIAFFLLVIVAFPLINYIQHRLVVRVVDRMKNQTVQELWELMLAEYQMDSDKRLRMYNAISYQTLIENVRRTKSYPITRQLSFEALMTFVTFVVHVINLVTKIGSIQQLSAFLNLA